MPKSIDEQRQQSAKLVKDLIAAGWEPQDIIGVTINCTLILAGMTDARAGYASSDNYSVLLSEVNKEEEALAYIHQQIDIEKAKSEDTASRALIDTRIKDSGENVVSIHKNK